MKKILAILLLLNWYPVYSQTTLKKSNNRLFKLPFNVHETDYLPNTIIIKFKSTLKINFKNLNLFEDKSGQIVSFHSKFPPQNKLLSIQSHSPSVSALDSLHLENIFELKYSSNEKLINIINKLLEDDNVCYAEPSYIFHTKFVPNDPLYSDTGQSYLRQVEAIKAWDINKNAKNIVIGIVDNGSDLNHDDLKENLYLNTADQINGSDDDKDNFVDNYFGWDLVGSSITNPVPDNDPNVKSNAGSHGVHVSGLASASSNNKIGIASIASNAKLLIVKVASDDDPDNIYRGYEGIKYAVDHGAQIINCSWGSIAGGAYGQDIINYAIDKDCLIIAAAGNENSSKSVYPAAYPGVMAVASVDYNDKKSATSNFGDYISIAAPGNDILSTIYNNKYGTLSGTSMAAPIVSSAAALVAAFFPSLSMQQVGQKLRITADYIDNKNSEYKGALGSGRLNVYKALTTSSPSVRNVKLTVTSNKSIAQGDTVKIYLDLKNFLTATRALKVKLVSMSSFLKLIDDQVDVGELGTLQTKTSIGPFKAIISPLSSDNVVATIQINYESIIDSYKDSERFSITLGLDYLNVLVNAISTSVTSNGRIGYNNADANNGLGFIYKNHNLLYEASLIVGASASKLSDNARSSNGTNEDFVKKIRIARVNNTLVDFEAKSEFDDSGNPNPINVYVKHRQLAFSKVPNDKYCLVEYTFINKNVSAINGLNIGLFTDWDVDVNGKDITEYDSFNRLAYTYSHFEKKSIYAGVKLLSNSGNPIYFPLSNDIPGNPVSNGFSKSEKFKTLSKGVASLKLGNDSVEGVDVSFVSGYGPYNIPPNDSVKIAFALLAGDDLTDLRSVAENAEKQYSTIENNRQLVKNLSLLQNFPNPARENTIIKFSIPDQGITTLDLFDSVGHKTKSLVEGNLPSGDYAINLNVREMFPGVYFYVLHHNNLQASLKMIIIK